MKDTDTRVTSAPVQSIGKLAKDAHGYETMGKFQSDRLVFPGEKRRDSTATVLVELSTPKKLRAKSASRRQISDEDFDDFLDVQKKVSRDEMDNIVLRLSRATYVSSVRETSAHMKRITLEEQQTKKRVEVNSTGCKLQYDPNRFQGGRKVSKKRLDDIVSRLSQTSKRHTQQSVQDRQEMNRKLGSLCSYRWMGIRNC